MKNTIIPAGYRVSVTTWENDGDNYKTEIIDGVSEKHIPFIVELCNLLKRDKFGNMSDHESTDELMIALNSLIEKHPERPDYCDSAEETYKGLMWKLGLTPSGYYATTVFDSIKIEYIPAPIEIENVTDRFITYSK